MNERSFARLVITFLLGVSVLCTISAVSRDSSVAAIAGLLCLVAVYEIYYFKVSDDEREE